MSLLAQCTDQNYDKSTDSQRMSLGRQYINQ